MDEKEKIESPFPPQGSFKFASYFYNTVSYTGAVLALLAFVSECFLFGLELFSPNSNVYLGIVTYILLPPFLILGLLLIPIGALRQRRLVRKGIISAEHKVIHIDPAIPQHRNGILVFIIGTSILVIMTMIGSYKAFHYTESVQFCGITCHDLMQPEYTTYQLSPHAKVKCVDCHIGSGADWYVRSKLSGLRQVYKTFVKSYPKPIPTPVHNLRPAVETCGQCHWPEKLYSSVELKRTYFPLEPSTDQNKLKWQLTMLMHVGQSREGNKDYGIHAHMYLDNEIYYMAEDEDRQKITWIRSIGKDGRETVFTSPDSKYNDTPPPQDLIRKMDCIDCHNRPTHRFVPPVELIDAALMNQVIDLTIPNIKAKSLEVLSKDYVSQRQAVAAIRSSLDAYYQSEHADFYRQHKDKIQEAIDQLTGIYAKNFFPEMKTRWDSHPDNIGHMISLGCFRCHDGEHRSKEDKAITRECSVCHSIVEQGYPDFLESSLKGLEFRHPFNEDESWKEMQCTDCHTGNY